MQSKALCVFLKGDKNDNKTYHRFTPDYLIGIINSQKAIIIAWEMP